MNRKTSVSIWNNRVYKRKHSFVFTKIASLILLVIMLVAGCSKNEMQDKTPIKLPESGVIASIYPANLTDSVALDESVAVTFQTAESASGISASTFTLKKGELPVEGTVIIEGTKAIFKPKAEFDKDTEYTATIAKNKNDKDEKGDDYTWKFKTGKHHNSKEISVISTIPVNHSASVALKSVISVTFNKVMDPATITSETFILKQGTTIVAGLVVCSGSTATFTPTESLVANTVYTVKIKEGVKDLSNKETEDSHDSDSDHNNSSMEGTKEQSGYELNHDYSWSFTTGTSQNDTTPPTVLSVVPANNATAIATSIYPAVTFSEAMNSTTINTTSFTLKQGSTAVAGTVAYSGTTATFTPSSALAANTVYTGAITTGAKDAAGNAIASNYSWSFTTAAAIVTDITPPTVLSVVPANNAISVATSIHPTATFSEAMNATTINTTNFTLMQGSTTVVGTVAYSGTTATFTPSSALAANTIYTGTIATGAKDAAGNAIASNYSWSFTTAVAIVADVTPPTVLSVVPANNATAIATSIHPAVTFSEAMNSTTINTTSFTLKQGSTAVAGTVAYSGTTATFTPSSALTANTVYTGAITTGAKDAAGNAISSNYSWSFTTVAEAQVVSWATQVWPIIQSKCTPCHGSSSGSAGVNMGSYAQVAAMSNSQIDNSGMYGEKGVTAAEQAIIKAWIAAGKLNN